MNDKNGASDHDTLDVEAEMIDDLIDESSVITIGDREFDIGVPSTRSIIWFINAFCGLGRRSQKHAASFLGASSPIDFVWAIGEVMQENDILAFGVAALQFDDRKEGRKFLRDNGVPLPQVLEAMAISIKKSGPLAQQLKNVLEGLVGKGTIETLIVTMAEEASRGSASG